MKILITGSASGIGNACVKHFSNHDIIHVDKDIVDLSNPELVKNFSDNLPICDVMIHSAGIREITAPHELDLGTWNEIFSVNVTSSFIISQSLIKKSLFNKKLFNIVNIASVSGFQAEPDRAAYVSSKHALIGLTRQLAWQYAKHGIRANAIAPGIIDTPMTEKYFTDSTLSNSLNKSIPVGHVGHPSHVVSLIDLCLTNTYLNGAVLVCDGGWSIGRDI